MSTPTLTLPHRSGREYIGMNFHDSRVTNPSCKVCFEFRYSNFGFLGINLGVGQDVHVIIESGEEVGQQEDADDDQKHAAHDGDDSQVSFDLVKG